jgi:hypothetical protein
VKGWIRERVLRDHEKQLSIPPLNIVTFATKSFDRRKQQAQRTVLSL